MILIMLTAILAGTLVLAVILTALLCWVLATPAFCGGTVVLMWLLLLIVFVAVGGIDGDGLGAPDHAHHAAGNVGTQTAAPAIPTVGGPTY